MDIEMPKVISGIWEPPPQGENQWEVMIGDITRLTVNAKSHQTAKRIAIDWLVSCCGDPERYRKSINARISEKWRGGIRARLRHRGEK